MSPHYYDYTEEDHFQQKQKGRWNALDPDCSHPAGSGMCSACETNDQENAAIQEAEIDQSSNEIVIIRDSCDVTVEVTDTQIAASLQAALQVAIAVVINITIADNERAEVVTAELLEKSQIKQTSRQKVVVVNSRSIDVTATDTDIAISLQLLLQILFALLVQLDIL